MQVHITNERHSSESIIIGIIQNEETKNTLQKIAEEYGLSPHFTDDFSGRHKEKLTLYTNGATPKKVMLVGLGKTPTFIKVREAFRSFAFRQKNKLTATVTLDASQLDAQSIEAAINGLELSTYNIHLFHTTKAAEHPLKNAKLAVFTQQSDTTSIQKAIQKGIATAQTQKEAFDLVNLDAGHLTPEALGNWTTESAMKYGYSAKVYDKKAIEGMGLKAYLAVNRGSEFAPAFIVAEYKHPNPVKKIGLVGKGVTFDTGGLNIKTAGMHYMKSDMGGAAAVLPATELAAKLQLPIHLITIVPATDNAVDALSVRPSDVIESYSGKTIEIIDTDAEGRLTLADGVAYMVKNFQPEILIDVATLTGASVRALGYHAGALLSNNEELAHQLKTVGEKVGERLWELPLYEEFSAELKSDVADIKNLGDRPMAGASTAAKFVQFFTNDHPNWAHLDIAGVAYGDSEYNKQKAGTAFGVNLLVEFFRTLAG